jgi:hypothetical protein
MTRAEIERLQRVHVVGVRSMKDKFVVVLSEPEIDAQEADIPNPDTWEVPWDQWVKVKANAAELV